MEACTFERASRAPVCVCVFYFIYCTYPQRPFGNIGFTCFSCLWVGGHGRKQVYVRKRPHLDAFLEAVSELFEVVVFTASQQVYAERLLNMIDPQKKFVK